jgi:hypothetical protein
MTDIQSGMLSIIMAEVIPLLFFASVALGKYLAKG